MEEAPSGFERRLVLQVLSHWRDARGEEEFPRFSAIVRQDLGEIWASCMVLNVPSDGEPTFILFGESFYDDGGRGLTGKGVSESSTTTLVGQALSFHQEVLKRQIPVTRGDEFINDSGERILFRSIVLPLSENGETLDKLLVAANYKKA